MADDAMRRDAMDEARRAARRLRAMEARGVLAEADRVVRLLAEGEREGGGCASVPADRDAADPCAGG